MDGQDIQPIGKKDESIMTKKQKYKSIVDDKTNPISLPPGLSLVDKSSSAILKMPIQSGVKSLKIASQKFPCFYPKVKTILKIYIK